VATAALAAAPPIEWRSPSRGGASAGRATATDSGRHVVVQVETIPDAAARAALAASGIELLTYLGSNAYFAAVSAPTGARASGAAAPSGVAMMSIDPAWKTHPLLQSGSVPWYAWVAEAEATAARGHGGDALVALHVLFHADVAQPEALHVLAARGGIVRDVLRSINGVLAWVPYEQLHALAEEDAVQWIEPPLPPLGPTNDSNRALTQVDQVQAQPYLLDGSGINVLVYDGGTALATHPDFGGRLVVRDTSPVDDHPTHVAGTIGADGSSSAAVGGAPRQWRGMAPGVTLQSYGFELVMSGGIFLYTNPGDLEADYDEAINVYGAEIANNSIGTNTAANFFPCAIEGEYGVTDTLIDAIVRGSLGSPMRVVFANGNERGSGRCGTTYGTTAPPATAKNHITVGALNSDTDAVTAFSSWGPTTDGRLKPDVSAPGCQVGGDQGVTSTFSSGPRYGAICGTSMAAPTVTGLLALVLQDWKAREPGAPLPRNAMLKALLAHTAVDRGNPGPDFQYGYGSVRVRAAIDFARGGNLRDSSIAHGDTQVHFTAIPPGLTSLKVTLAWDDVPGTPNVIPALVNDIDVVLIDPAGQTVHRPWTLDPSQPALPARRDQEDHRNNIEQVVVDAPAPGVWRIEVTGTAIPQGPQPFALVADGQLQPCSTAATARFDRVAYSCGGPLVLELNDCDLDLNPDLRDTVGVRVVSDSDAAGEQVVLTETEPASGEFRATIAVSAAPLEGALAVKNGDQVSATYAEADDGNGNERLVTASTAIDCVPPVVGGVAVPDLNPSRSVVTLETDEEAVVRVRYGLACEALTAATAATPPGKMQLIELTGLLPSTTYFFVIDATDAAGNTVSDDNGGGCYTFTTAERTDFLTEEFIDDNDLQNVSLTFTPDGSAHFYALCRSPASAFPTNPAGGETLSLSDDSTLPVVVSGDATVSLYGVSYSSLFVGSNGYVTFAAPDVNFEESPAAHFELPRVAALFDDLVPVAGTRVSVRQLADRVAVTWEGIAEFGTANQNSFQIELFFDGSLRITYLAIAARDGLAGLSRGTGMPQDFNESDLGGAAQCAAGTPTPSAPATPTPTAATPTPSVTAGAPRVLYFENTEFDSVVPEALASVGLAALTTVTSDVDTFRAQLADNGPWNLVIFGEAFGTPFASSAAELSAYVEAGGAVLASTYLTAGLAGLLDATALGTNARTVQTSSHPIFTGLGNSFQAANPGSPGEIFSLIWRATPGAVELGTLGDGAGAVLGNGGRTLLQGPLFDSFANLAKGQRFVANEIAFLLGLDGPVELFGPFDFDLQFTTLTYTPHPLTGSYAVCAEPAAAFPVDPSAGIPLILDDDDAVGVLLTGGASIPFFGTGRDRFFVGSNGYVTFDDGDARNNAAPEAFYALARVAALMTDLDPTQGSGEVRAAQLADRAVVTFANIPHYQSTNSNSFQIELFFTGTIRITYLRMDDSAGAAGLSPGFGVPNGFEPDDLSAGPGCSDTGIPTRTPTATPSSTPATAPPPREALTELFIGDNDLDRTQLVFTPDASPQGYTLCRTAVASFPTDPAAGTVLSLPDDGAATIPLLDGTTVVLHGVSYDTIHVGSNGYIIFAERVIDVEESLAAHFALPRVSALFDDLDPSAGGVVRVAQFADRIAVTFVNVPQFALADANSFQIELFFDGVIRLTYLDVAATDGLVGLSPGGGLPPGFVESDLASAAPCGGGAATATATPTATPTLTPTRGARLVVVPSEITIGPGTTFDVLIQVDTDAAPVDGAAAFLSFDPAELQVERISAGTALPMVLTSKFSNAAGTLDYAAGAIEDQPSGVFTLATVRFTAIGTGDSPLELTLTPPRQSDVTRDSSSVLAGVVNGLVHVVQADFTGGISLQGRPQPPDPRLRVPLTVDVTPAGGGETQACAAMTDEFGRFACEGIPPGDYVACVKNAHTLRNCRSLTVPIAGGPVDFGLLREGDINDDNCVLLVDFSILAASFGRCAGEPSYDRRADLDENDCVVLVDFSLLSTNFGACGDGSSTATEAPRAPAVLGSSAVTLALDPATASTRVGDEIAIRVEARAGAQAIDGVSAYLDFDPSVLQVVRMLPGADLPVAIENRADNGVGRIDFSAGTFAQFPSGGVTVVTVTFRAIAPSAGSAVLFNDSGARTSDVTFGGASVLGDLQAASIAVGGQPTASPQSTPTTVEATATATPAATATASGIDTRSPTATPGTPTMVATATHTPPATPTHTRAATVTHTAAATPTQTPVATATATHTPAATATLPSPTLTPQGCRGDCDGDGTVEINELILGVNLALGQGGRPCESFDGDGNGTISVNELVAAVSNSLNGCIEPGA
jgi:hypothetical protein